MNALTITPNSHLAAHHAPQTQFIELDYWQYFSFIRAARAYYRHIAKQARAQSKHRHTYKAYKGNLKFFLRWLVVRGNPFPTPEVMESYVVYLKNKRTKHGKPLADASIQAYLTVARIFLGYLAEASINVPMVISDDPIQLLMVLQLENKIQKAAQLVRLAAKVENPPPAVTTDESPLDAVGNWISQEDAAMLLNRIDLSTWVGRRDRALIMLGLYSGMRVSSLAQVTLASFKRHRGNTWLIRDVVHKRGKLYPVTVDVVAVRAVMDYVEFYNNQLAPDDPRRIGDDDPLWRCATKAGNIFTDVARARHGMQEGGLRDVIEKRGQDVGLRFAPHDMRRSWAAWARESTMEDDVASAQMGHANVEQTKQYMGDIKDYTPLNIANYGSFFLTAMLQEAA